MEDLNFKQGFKLLNKLKGPKLLVLLIVVLTVLLAAGQFFESLGASKAAQDCKDCKEKTEMPSSENN